MFTVKCIETNKAVVPSGNQKLSRLMTCFLASTLVGAELHRGHGGEDPEVGERAQAVPGVGSRGAQLLAAALQRAGGPSQGRLQLGALLQDPQPTLGRVGWVPLCLFFFFLFAFCCSGAGRPQKPVTPSPSLCEWRPLFPTKGDPTPPTISPTTLLTLMYTGREPNQQKFVIMGFFPRRRIEPSYERNGPDSTPMPSCGFAASFLPTFKVTAL